MDHSHHEQEATSKTEEKCASCAPKRSVDWLLWISISIVLAAFGIHILLKDVLVEIPSLLKFTESIYIFMNKMWWGLGLGVLFVGMLAGVPRSLVQSIIGKGGTFNGILRAAAGGVLLDLCSHGILLVGMQLYKRGASTGQMAAFLIASPWNSISLTVILWSLVGIKWTLSLLIFSLLIALVSGVIFDKLSAAGVLPKNPNTFDDVDLKPFKSELRSYISKIKWSPITLFRIIKTGLLESKMIFRWIFFGVVLAAAIQTFVSTAVFASVFGPTLLGLGATLVFATILEVCSEGSVPLATDFLLRAGAPGNMFAFLMTGVSTDYTEVMSIKETTLSWKIALFLPLITLPQVIVIAVVLNAIG